MGGRHGSLADHLALMRVHHWVKNVFVLPGVLVALTVAPGTVTIDFGLRSLLALLALGLVTSGNYVLNDLLDAPFDRTHPGKRLRPAAAGRVSRRLAWAQWVGLVVAGMALGAVGASEAFAWTLVALVAMAGVYNARPLRSKDVPYLDVLSEAVNNPLRMLAGWFIVEPPVRLIPVSLLVSYWMIGAYFMAIKRLAEYRALGDGGAVAVRYRPAFASYSEPRLLVTVVFYAAASMLFLGAFMMRYRMELVLAFPLVAWVMASYLSLAFRPDSPAQEPETLYRQPALVVPVLLCVAAMTWLLFVDVPVLYRLFQPTLPTGGP